MKVPGVEPPPGRLASSIETVTLEGEVPLSEESLSHPPPSAVLALAVQLRLPEPPFKIWIDCGGTLAADVCNENVNCPASLSKYGVFVAAMVKVTGMVRFPFAVDVRETCP